MDEFDLLGRNAETREEIVWPPHLVGLGLVLQMVALLLFCLVVALGFVVPAIIWWTYSTLT